MGAPGRGRPRRPYPSLPHSRLRSSGRCPHQGLRPFDPQASGRWGLVAQFPPPLKGLRPFRAEKHGAQPLLFRGAGNCARAPTYRCMIDKSWRAFGTATIPRSSGRVWIVKAGMPSSLDSRVREA